MMMSLSPMSLKFLQNNSKYLVCICSDMTISIYQIFPYVRDDIVMIIHHNAQRLAKYKRGPHHNVAPTRSVSLLHKFAKN